MKPIDQVYEEILHDWSGQSPQDGSSEFVVPRECACVMANGPLGNQHNAALSKAETWDILPARFRQIQWCQRTEFTDSNFRQFNDVSREKT